MKIVRETRVYCPRCNKHTVHTIRLYSKKPERGQSMGMRRRARKLKGYVGKVKGKATQYKISKRQKALLVCKECGYIVERVYGTRTKKKLEIKTQ
jgi:large subunit ribosomal protein L44e